MKHDRHSVTFTEKAQLRQSILGWSFFPAIPGNCPLFVDLCDIEQYDEPVCLSREDYPSMTTVLAIIRAVAKDKGIAILVCGSKAHPTIMLRRISAGASSAPAFPEQRIDLVWGVFAEDASQWVDYGYSETLDKLAALEPGQWMKILSSPKKETRCGDVIIRRKGARSWEISGVVTDSWDDVEGLAQTLDVLMEGDIPEAEDVDVDDPDAVNLYLAGYNSRHGTTYRHIKDENAFRSMIPFSAYTCEPGLDLEFKRTVRGDVKSLISALSKAEDDLLAQSNELWNQLNSALGVEVVE